MDPLSITASAIAVLQIAGTSGNALNALLSLRDAPQQLQQLWNEAEALRGESQHELSRRSLLRCQEVGSNIVRSCSPRD
jgi:hypothetical protein